MPRFIVLEHTGAPDDPAGRHWDLLLEDGPACRTWRLAALPAPGGPAVAAVELPPHRLAWLDHEAGDVSGGRGFARRIDAGTCEPAVSPAEAGAFTPPSLALALRGRSLTGTLVLRAEQDGWLASLTPGEPSAAGHGYHAGSPEPAP